MNDWKINLIVNGRPQDFKPKPTVEETEIIKKIEQEYSNPPVSGYIGESGYSGSPGISISGMAWTFSTANSSRGDTPPITMVHVDTETGMIYSIARSYGGEMQFVYGGPVIRPVSTGPVRVINTSEISRLVTRREFEPVRTLGDPNPVSFTHVGPEQWELETTQGEVFRT
jgi:hypothetical protein